MTIDVTKSGMMPKTSVPTTTRDRDLVRMDELMNKPSLTKAEKGELEALRKQYGDGPERAKAASHSPAPNVFSAQPNNNNPGQGTSIFN